MPVVAEIHMSLLSFNRRLQCLSFRSSAAWQTRAALDQASTPAQLT
jgi:hypothetical protein